MTAPDGRTVGTRREDHRDRAGNAEATTAWTSTCAGKTRVRVIWRGDDAISGGSRFDEDGLEKYSRDLDTVKKWLARR